jgi:carbamoyl-phosphate synthase large subunit
LFAVAEALRSGAAVDQVAAQTDFDPWFVTQMAGILTIESDLCRVQPLAPAGERVAGIGYDLLRRAKRHGLSDAQIARALGLPPAEGAMQVRARRLALGLKANFYRVDTCAAEFEAFTPYLYSTYEAGDEAEPTDNRKALILGGGPNRIGQGIEFDYCCVHACFALKELGYETIMVNCNPETVSTDYDTADRLYFEPLTLEDVLNIVDEERPDGVIVQFGGQTPLNLAAGLAGAGAPIWGTPPDAIDLAEDRVRFGDLLRRLDIPSPEWGTAQSFEAARRVASRIGYPVLVRPSYVLGGRAMEIAYDEASLGDYLAEAAAASPDGPVLIDHYLEDAFELDVDALADGERVVIAGLMQHIEEAGVHSGDSACVLPPYKISLYHQNIVYEYVERLGLALGVKGLMNVQLAIKDDIVYVLEVNPRASRTVPYVSKATGAPIAKLAARVMAGHKLADLGFTETPKVNGFFVKEAVLPFKKFLGSDYRLGPEMRSTGEVMGHAASFGHAFAKAQIAAGTPLPTHGSVLITVNDFDKGAVVKIARDLHRLGFRLFATRGTADWLARVGLPVTPALKVSEGHPNVRDMVERGELQLIINTPLGARAHDDSRTMRTAAVLHGVPIMTTLSAATAAVNGIAALKAKELGVTSLQAHYARNQRETSRP